MPTLPPSLSLSLSLPLSPSLSPPQCVSLIMLHTMAGIVVLMINHHHAGSQNEPLLRPHECHTFNTFPERFITVIKVVFSPHITSRAKKTNSLFSPNHPSKTKAPRQKRAEQISRTRGLSVGGGRRDSAFYIYRSGHR